MKIEVDTKFNIGDEVYVRPKKGLSNTCFIVIKIDVQIVSCGFEVTYTLVRNTGMEYKSLNNIPEFLLINIED